MAHLERLVDGKKTVLVILDDDHSRDHVLQEMHLYGRFVTPGSYLIVEDTNVNGHPVLNEFGPGPMEAVERFRARTTSNSPATTKTALPIAQILIEKHLQSLDLSTILNFLSSQLTL